VLRKVRAALIISGLWVLCWVPLGRALDDVLTDILAPGPRIDDPRLGMVPWAIWGALSRLGFAIVLGLRERGRPVDTLSAFRVLSWGAVGSAVLPMLYTVYTLFTWPGFPGPGSLLWLVTLLPVAISALLGVVCAGVTLVLMRAGTAR